MREKEIERWNNKISISIIITIVFIFIGVTNMNAAGFLEFGDSTSWKEEVLLHNGSKIIVERSQSYGGNHEINQTPPVKEHSIKFALPGTNKVIKWQDEFSHEIGRSNFILLALHIIDDTPYIITTPRLCLSYNKWGRPNPPYVIFKYENKEWKRIELSELPVEFKNINVVIETKGEEKELLRQGLVSAEKVKELNSSLKQPEFKTILRTPIKIWCEEMIRVKDGWYGIDWFSNQPSSEECLNFCKQKNVDAQNCPCDRLFKSKTKGKGVKSPLGS